MSIRNKEYIELLKHSFNEEKFIEFIIDLLNLDSSDLNRNIVENIITSKQFKDNILHYKHIANYYDGLNNIGVFVIKLNNTTTTQSRNMQRNFVATLLSKYNLDACLVSFYSERETSWRLSFVKRELSFTDKGIKENLTSAKRYSYLVGENESVHTAQEFLFKLLEIDNRKITLDDIEKQFDVEKVTKKFFEEYKEKYLELKEFFDKNEDFQTEAKNCDFDSVEFAKKLMGQIVFLYFLQKKGWLGVQLIPNEISIEEYNELLNTNDSVSQNLIRQYFVLNDDKYVVEKTKLRITEVQEDIINLTNVFINTKYNMSWGTGRKDFIRNIFNQAKIEHKNFFDDYLEYFFYKGLNEKRENQYFPLFNCKIPFLNGGLFEPLNNYRWSSAHFEIPNTIFSNDNKDGILDFLDLYNFTIDEEEPLEKDIAVDPEMLGKIFENLLDVNDRKSKGAFYTPREIVHYMCQESLANYLVNKVNVDYDEIIKFVRYGDVIFQYDWEQSVNESKEFEIGKTIYDNLLEIDEALFNVKVADPAVGSGAFPLGMLNEIVKLRLNIQTYILIKKELGTINIEDLYNTNHLESDVYKIKLQTIENCIYAVDIETSAIDITKLRLWLSLVVDYPNEKEPRPLPNLDCKIMQGNSLIDEFEGVPLFSNKMLENNLKKYRRNESQVNEVHDIQIQQTLFQDNKKIDEYIDIMLNLQKEYFITSDNKIKKELKSKIDSIQMGLVEESLRNDYQKLMKFKSEAIKRQKPWFIWELEFYDVFKNNNGFDIVIGNPPYVNIEKIDNKNILSNYLFAYKKYDLYVLFFEKSLSLLNNDGILSFITSNKFFYQEYALKMREKFVKDYTINKLINFDFNIFDNATVKTCITIMKNAKPIENIIDIIDVSSESDKTKFTNHEYIQLHQKEFKNDELFRFYLNYNNDEKKLVNKIKNNSDFVLNDICFVGYGLRACSKDGKLKKKDYISEFKLNDNYKKYFEGKDTGKWNVLDGSKFVNYDKETLYNCAFEQLFENEKLSALCTLSDITKLRFIYDNEQYYNNHSVVNCVRWKDLKNVNHVSVKRNINEKNIINSNMFELKYIQGLLNSKLIKYYFDVEMYDGTHFYPDHIKALPIFNAKREQQEFVIDLVNKLSVSDSIELQNELDNYIYKLYNLSVEEIKIIDEHFSNKGVDL